MPPPAANRCHGHNRIIQIFWVEFSLDVVMASTNRSHIVADGRWRILRGSGRELASWLRARLMRRTSPLLKRASLLGRVAIRYRIWRFIQRRLARHAPPQGLYSERKVSL